VNPESVLYPNTQAATQFGFVDIPVGLDEVSFAQHKSEMQFMPLAKNVQKPGNLAIVERNGNAIELAQIMPTAPNTQQPGNFAIVERNVDSNPIDLVQLPPVDSSVVQKTAPGDFSIEDHEAVDSTLIQTRLTQKSANGLN